MKMKLKKLAGSLLAVGMLHGVNAAAAEQESLQGKQAEQAKQAKQAKQAELKSLLVQEKAKQNLYQARFPNLALARKAAISFHANLLEADYDKGYLILELSREEKAELEKFGFKMTVAHDFMRQRDAILNRLHATDKNGNLTSQPLLGKNAANLQGVIAEAIPNYSCYETVEETFAAMQGFTTSYPNLASVKVIGQSWEKANNLGGYDLNVLKLTNKNTAGPKPILFINSAMHAREYTTAPLVLAFARQLLSGYGSNADMTWLLDHHEIHMLLHTNPDGRKKAESGLSWRKNTNRNYCGATSNSRGADLNRNFSATWNVTNGSGSSGSQCNETYRGPRAASEPETQAVEAYVRSIWPDRRGPGLNDPAPSDTSGIHLDIHSYSQLVLWPWGETRAVAPNGVAMQTFGRRLAYFNGYTPQQSVGLYPTDGTSDAVSYAELGVPSITIELGTSFFQSCSTYTGTIVPKNLPALLYAAKVSRAPYLLPGGPDVTSLLFSPNAATTPVAAGTSLSLAASATDTRFYQKNGTEPTQAIAAAEYYVDVPPWQSGAVARPLSAADGAFNSTTEGLAGTVSTTGWSSGKHIVFVRARDASGAWGPVSAGFVQIR